MTPPTVQLWRINLKPASQQGVDAATFCIDRGIVGIGWALDPAPTTKDDDLQVTERCIMFPSTCKISTMAIECLFTTLEQGKRIGLQVKSGGTPINRDDYATFDGRAWMEAPISKVMPDDSAVAQRPARWRWPSHWQLIATS